MRLVVTCFFFFFIIIVVIGVVVVCVMSWNKPAVKGDTPSLRHSTSLTAVGMLAWGSMIGREGDEVQ